MLVVALSNKEQYREFSKRYNISKDVTIYCDNPNFYDFLKQQKENIKEIENKDNLLNTKIKKKQKYMNLMDKNIFKLLSFWNKKYINLSLNIFSYSNISMYISDCTYLIIGWDVHG